MIGEPNPYADHEVVKGERDYKLVETIGRQSQVLAFYPPSKLHLADDDMEKIEKAKERLAKLMRQ